MNSWAVYTADDQVQEKHADFPFDQILVRFQADRLPRVNISNFNGRFKRYPTGPFTIFEHQDQESDEFYVNQKSRMTDHEAKKLCKGRPGKPMAESPFISELLVARRAFSQF